MTDTVRWRLLTLWIVVFTAATGIAQIQNRHRVNDIERERVQACVRAYSAISQTLTVLAPAFTHHGNPYNDINQRWVYVLGLVNPAHCHERIRG